MQKTQGTYQWQSNQMVLPPSIYTDMQGKGVTQSGYQLGGWEVPFPSEYQIKGMAQYRVPYMMDSSLQDIIVNKLQSSINSYTRSLWKDQILNGASANGIANLNSISLNPGEKTLDPIEIGKTGNISFGGNSLVKLCLGELAAGFNRAAYMKVQGIRPGAGYTGHTNNGLLPCPPSCCCGKANCVHCNVSWSNNGTFSEGEYYGFSNPDKLVRGVNLLTRIVSAWQGLTGFSFNNATWEALDWNNGQNSWRIVWTQ
jgi:hypothetical protein